MKPADHYHQGEAYLAAAERIALSNLDDSDRTRERMHTRTEEFEELINLALVHATLAQYVVVTTPPPAIERRYIWFIRHPAPRVHPVGEQQQRLQAPTAESGGAVNRKGIDAMGQIQDSEQVVLSVESEDAAGNAVTDSGTRTWAVDNAALATLTDNGDGTQTLAAVGPVGTVTVTVTDTEASPDGGTTPGQVFQGSLAVDIVSGPVTQILISEGTPTAKPAPTIPPGGANPATGGPVG